MTEAYTGWSAAEVELLVQGASLTGLIEKAEAEIARDGITVGGAKGGRVRHPATITLAAARTELRQTLRQLRVDREEGA